MGAFGSSTEYNTDLYIFAFLNYAVIDLYCEASYKDLGVSIRCVMD
jgi:hypothetical protein